MFGKKLLGIAAAAAALTLGGNARAEDTYESCIENCDVQYGKQSTKSSAKSTKSAKKTTKKAVSSDGSAKAEARVDVNIETQTAEVDRQLEAARAEERARAAEQFRAEEDRIKEQHAADIEQARADERARVEAQLKARHDADLVRVRDQERIRLEAATAEDEPDLLTGIGTMVSVGGGVMNYTEWGPRSVTSPGGFWDARLHVGSRSVVGFEAAYVGSAQDIYALGLNEAAFLMSNGLEGAVRLNAPITFSNGLLEPYTFGGLGWQNFNLINDVATSSVEPYDNVMSVPMGVGVAMGIAGVTLDTRATYRHTIGSELLGPTGSSFDEDSLNQWSVGAGLGFEF